MPQKLTLISAGLLALIASGAQAAVDIKIPAKVCDVTAYGADGFHQQIVPNTEAFEKAIDDCASAGGGTVRVPAGNWLVAPFALKSNIRLLLEKNATLVASSEESAWKIADHILVLEHGHKARNAIPSEFHNPLRTDVLIDTDQKSS